jgi:hypothetical protein
MSNESTKRPGSDLRFDELLAGFVDDALDDDGMAELNAMLTADPTWRKLLVDVCLQRKILRRLAASDVSRRVKQASLNRWRRAMLIGIGALVAVAAVWLITIGPRIRLPMHETDDAPVIAHVSKLRNCRWASSAAPLSEGNLLRQGQTLQLSSGAADILYENGALITLAGPANYRLESAAEGVLLIGQLTMRATGQSAEGFAVRTSSARTVDLGTEFVALAAADGHSQIDVTEGSVEVQVGSNGVRHRLNAGESIDVEPGNPSVTAKIESGDNTPAFRFATISPPSATDYADESQKHATIRVVRGKLARESGGVDLLIDGRAQSHADSPHESVFFENGSEGMILMDLGRPIAIEKINTYSWHLNRGAPTDRVRATQKYLLYGSNGAVAPTVDGTAPDSHWALLARVNTDETFGVSHASERPPQQAVSITASQGAVGTYRYLLWDVHPTLGHLAEDNTFYGEFDVYGK